jgi:hypothetical protein
VAIRLNIHGKKKTEREIKKVILDKTWTNKVNMYALNTINYRIGKDLSVVVCKSGDDFIRIEMETLRPTVDHHNFIADLLKA